MKKKMLNKVNIETKAGSSNRQAERLGSPTNQPVADPIQLKSWVWQYPAMVPWGFMKG
jgi:hypothetical protein